MCSNFLKQAAYQYFVMIGVACHFSQLILEYEM